MLVWCRKPLRCLSLNTKLNTVVSWSRERYNQPVEFRTTSDNNRDRIEQASRHGVRCWLIDTSAYCRFEEAAAHCDTDFFKVIDSLADEEYFFLNDVLIELVRGPRNQNEVIGRFGSHMLCAEGGMDPNYKENRFLIEEDGEVRYIVLNKISSTDYMQISLAQNYEPLLLVSNDAKMIRSASHVLSGRAFGTKSFLNKLIEAYPTNSDIQEISRQCKLMFQTRYGFKDIDR